MYKMDKRHLTFCVFLVLKAIYQCKCLPNFILKQRLSLVFFVLCIFLILMMLSCHIPLSLSLYEFGDKQIWADQALILLVEINIYGSLVYISISAVEPSRYLV